MRKIAIIPARLESARLPRKMLLDETGMPLICHTYLNVARCGLFDDVYVATDSDEICAVISECCPSPKVVMTGAATTGTARVTQAASTIGLVDDDVVVNIQGDEPEISRADLKEFVQKAPHPGRKPTTPYLPLHYNPQIWTMVFPISAERAEDPNLVKAVIDKYGRAMYFSRARIPWRNPELNLPNTGYFGHIGIYMCFAKTLFNLRDLTAPNVMARENLEQLTWLWHGLSVHVLEVESAPPGIDTREDYDAFVKRQRMA